MNEAPVLVSVQETIYRSKNPTRKWLHSIRRELIISTVRRFASRESGRALEVGPGSGLYIPVLAECCAQVTVTDVEQEYLKHVRPAAQACGNVAVVRDDITRSSLPSNAFDLILCTEVIEHLRDSQQALREIHRLLRPGGLLILSTPQKYSTLELLARIAFLPGIIQLVRLLYREPVREMGHINLLTRRGLARQIASAGFQIEESFTSGFYMPVLAELGGETAVRLERWLEKKCRGGACEGLLWTQYVVARA